MTDNRLEEIRRVKETAEDDLLNRSGVTGVDIGYKYVGGEKTDELAIRVFVKEKKDVRGRQRIPREIEGVKTDVIEREIVLHQLGVPIEDLAVHADTGTYDPLKGGISIGPCRIIDGKVYVGTLGAIVRDNATGNPMLLSNFHVMCVDNAWTVGDTIAQQSRVDGGTCPASVVGTLQRSALGGQVDCAVASHTARGQVCEIVDIGTIAGTAVAALGMDVRKRGRTTALTYGTVDSVNLTVNVDYGPDFGVVTLTNQIGITVDTTQSTQFGNKGDSGSVVVDDSNRVVGLYFAGSSEGDFGVANPIQAVLSALNVSLCRRPIKPLKEGLDKPLFHEKLDLKDFKNENKELILEKQFPDKSPKEIFENKFTTREDFSRIPFETINPIEAIGGQVGGGIEQRLARLEAALAPFHGEERGGDGCIDFGTLPLGVGPNPRIEQGITFRVLDHTGSLMANSGITTMGTPFTGLNCGYTLEIELGQPCTSVDLMLMHMAQPGTIEAFNEDGSSAGSDTMSAAQGVAQGPFAYTGTIKRVVVRAPSDEMLLLQFCCRGKPEKEKPEKEKIEKLEKLEFKELKREKLEKPEKLEIKESKDKPEKEKIEKPESKELKREKLEKPEKLEFEKATRVDKSPVGEVALNPSQPIEPMVGDPVEERLRRIEDALARMTHFIGPELRPDLSGGALTRERDLGDR